METSVETLADFILIRWSLLREQYCVAPNRTKRELAEYIRQGWGKSEVLRGHMADRYPVEYVEQQISAPVDCADFPGRKHYIFEAGNFSYLE